MKKLALIFCCICFSVVVIAQQRFPTAFTPNGDGKNDVFAKGYKIQVADRYGYEIFEGPDGWNGITKWSKKADAGVYFYVIELPSGEKIKGSVELVKEREK